jgi:hypothetical protein
VNRSPVLVGTVALVSGGFDDSAGGYPKCCQDAGRGLLNSTTGGSFEDQELPREGNPKPGDGRLLTEPLAPGPQICELIK